MKNLKLFCNSLLFLLISTGFVFNNYAKATNKDLVRDTNNLIQELKLLRSQFKSIKTNLTNPRILVDLPEQTSSALNSLHGALGLAEDRMESISIIPSWRNKMQSLIRSCKNLKKTVGDCKNAAYSIAVEIKPAKKIIDRLYYLAVAMEVSIPVLEKSLKIHISSVDDAQKCIDESSEKNKKSLQEALDTYINVSDIYIKEKYEEISIMESGINEVNKKIGELDKLIDDKADKIVHLKKLVSDLNHDVRKLLSPLRDVEWVLEQKVSISIPYTNPETIWKISHAHISISVHDIIKDINAVEHEIEKYVGKIIFEILKKVHLDKYVKEFIDKSNDWIGSALSRLHININFEIPGINDFEKNIKEFKKSIQELGKLNTNFSVDSINKISSTIDDSSSSIKGVESNCKKL